MSLGIKDDGGPAFPLATPEHPGGGYVGMTLRDWFAGMALQHIPALLDAHEENKSYAIIAEWSYKVADAMLEARNQGGRPL